MSLANRLSAVQPNKTNRGCQTCHWIRKLPQGDRDAFDEWIAAERSLTQLWEIATGDPENPFPVSLTALRHHVRLHHEP